MKTLRCLILRRLLPASITWGGLLLMPHNAPAQPDYTKKERRQCVVCHEGSWQSGKYTAAGEYYKEHHTFRGYRPSGAKGQTQK